MGIKPGVCFPLLLWYRAHPLYSSVFSLEISFDPGSDTVQPLELHSASQRHGVWRDAEDVCGDVAGVHEEMCAAKISPSMSWTLDVWIANLSVR